MSEYWKSTAKKFCEYCKIWIADNKPSIAIHESGRTHKENVQRKLEDIKKQSMKKRSEDQKMNASMAAIEKAAMEAMKNDLASNPSLKKQYGDSATLSQMATSSKKEEKETKEKPSKEAVKSATNEAAKRKSETTTTTPVESKIGKWQTYEQPKEAKPEKKLDLQLPTKTKVAKSYELQVDDVKPQPVEETKPKPKWKPLSSFEPVDIEQEEQDTSIKQEPIEASGFKCEDLPIKNENDLNVVKRENVLGDDMTIKNEKVVCLGSSKKTKNVVFKKRRNDGQNMRQRNTDD